MRKLSIFTPNMNLVTEINNVTIASTQNDVVAMFKDYNTPNAQEIKFDFNLPWTLLIREDASEEQIQRILKNAKRRKVYIGSNETMEANIAISDTFLKCKCYQYNIINKNTVVSLITSENVDVTTIEFSDCNSEDYPQIIH